jgi:AraC-like DNA-binding protein
MDHPQLEAVGRVRHWMESHPADRRPLPDLAKQVGMSYASLRKYFPEVTGMSLSDYRILCRVHRAQRLLADFNVQETAAQLGFADPFVFSNQFKARTGMSPRAYRKQMKGGITI